MKNLGYMNGWNPDKYPVEYLAHDQAVRAGEKHDIVVRERGRCAADVTCKTCDITWSVDSGD